MAEIFEKTSEEGEYLYDEQGMEDVPIDSGEAENEAGKDSDRYF